MKTLRQFLDEHWGRTTYPHRFADDDEDDSEPPPAYAKRYDKGGRTKKRG